MKKILLACFSMIICCVIQAQSIDNFVLGEKRMMSILHVPSGFKYVSTGHQNTLQYANKHGDYGVSYEMTFKNDILYNFVKNDYDVFSESRKASPENKIMDVFTNLVEEFGNPQTSNESSSYIYYGWELPDSRLSLRCSWTIKKEEVAGGSLFAPMVMKSFCYLDVKIQWIAKETINQIGSQTSNNSSNYTASGSGFVLSSNGVIVTNYHVIDGANGVDVFVNRDNGVKKYGAKVLISDKTNDISLLQIDDNTFDKFPSLPYAVKTTIQDVGTNVFALGYPMSNI